MANILYPLNPYTSLINGFGLSLHKCFSSMLICKQGISEATACFDYATHALTQTWSLYNCQYRDALTHLIAECGCSQNLRESFSHDCIDILPPELLNGLTASDA